MAGDSLTLVLTPVHRYSVPIARGRDQRTKFGSAVLLARNLVSHREDREREGANTNQTRR
jgi:hypothetical protein